MDYEETEKERYERMWSSLVKKKFTEKPADYRGRIPDKNIIDFAEFISKKGVKGKVLDIGCGNGRHSVYFAKKGFEVYGIDVSKNAIEIARWNAKENKVKVNFRAGSVFSLPYSKDSFDVIIDSGCLHHLRKPQWKMYLKNILRVLKKNAYMELHCFSVNTPPLGVFRARKRNWSLRRRHYNHFFNEKEIKELFKDFEILKIYETKKDREGNALIFKEVYMKKK
ncbi:class I SAM-dependent methyltransferase [Candidatus Woesearchaeota archaeon]|nr:class I SAM-dependent methyltransferase [Candidatus Woesearchaeota archaeon]